jgi:hypothetical protein
MRVVFLFAAWAVAAWRDGTFPRLAGARRAAAAALAAVLLLCLGPSLRHVRHAAYGLAPSAAVDPSEETPPE